MAADPAPEPVACLGCAQQRKRADSIAIDLENAEVEMRSLRRRISLLKGQLDKERKEHPNFDMAQRVYAYWKERVCPRSRAFSEQAQKAVLARINEGHVEAEFFQAIEGCRWRKQTDPVYGKHFDLELICRSEDHVRRFIRIYEERLVVQEQEKADVLRDKLRLFYELTAVENEIETQDDLDGMVEFSLDLMTA